MKTPSDVLWRFISFSYDQFGEAGTRIVLARESQLGNAKASDALNHESRLHLSLTQHVFKSGAQIVAGKEAEGMSLQCVDPDWVWRQVKAD